MIEWAGFSYRDRLGLFSSVFQSLTINSILVGVGLSPKSHRTFFFPVSNDHD